MLVSFGQFEVVKRNCLKKNPKLSYFVGVNKILGNCNSKIPLIFHSFPSLAGQVKKKKTGLTSNVLNIQY